VNAILTPHTIYIGGVRDRDNDSKHLFSLTPS
jgi:hypothetical protein